jgi:hypothetical protein
MEKLHAVRGLQRPKHRGLAKSHRSDRMETETLMAL